MKPNEVYEVKWNQMISTDINWYQMISNDIKWYQMISNDMKSRLEYVSYSSPDHDPLACSKV